MIRWINKEVSPRYVQDVLNRYTPVMSSDPPIITPTEPYIQITINLNHTFNSIEELEAYLDRVNSDE